MKLIGRTHLVSPQMDEIGNGFECREIKSLSTNGSDVKCNAKFLNQNNKNSVIARFLG